MISPLGFLRGMPSGKVINYASVGMRNIVQGTNGWREIANITYRHIKKRAVFAFLMAISTEPSHAPSMRAKVSKFAPASTQWQYSFLILIQ